MRHRSLLCVLGIWLSANCGFAADITGIWAGQQEGRFGQPEDVAFRFKVEGAAFTGKMFGDEFDIPIAEGSLTGDQVRFTVTTTNYFSGTKLKYIYSGTMKDGEITLVRERLQTPEDKTANRPPGKQTLKLKRLN
jgi:hypothetical protein